MDSFSKSRIFPAICGVALLVGLTGCDASRPSDREATSHLEAELPPHFNVVKSEVEAVRNGPDRVNFKAALRVAPRETLYIQADSPALKEMTRHLLLKNDRGELSDKLLEELLEEVYSFTHEAIFLKPFADHGDEVILYARISSEKAEEGWRWSGASIERVAIFGGRPRSGFSPDALVLGSSEESEFLAKLQGRLDELENEETKRVGKRETPISSPSFTQDQKTAPPQASAP